MRRVSRYGLREAASGGTCTSNSRLTARHKRIEVHRLLAPADSRGPQCPHVNLWSCQSLDSLRREYRINTILFGQILKAGCGIYSVPESSDLGLLAYADRTQDDFAGVDADPEPHRGASPCGPHSVDRVHGVTHVQGCPDGWQGPVGHVGLKSSEYGHQPIAEKLADHPALSEDTAS